MFEQRDLKIDLVALGLLALTVFLAASLLSYAPADPPGKLVFPQAAEVQNLCGRAGAIVALFLLKGFGLGAYYLLVSAAALTAVLLARHQVSQPVLRIAGWLLSLVGICTLATMALPHLAPGPVIGSGGYLGATGEGLLLRQFADVGAYILIASSIIVGLLLSTDYVLVRLLAWALRKPLAGLGWGLVRLGRLSRPRAKPARAAAALDALEEVDEEEEGPAVVMAPRGGLHEEVEEEEAETPAEVGGESPRPAGDTRSRLRIRKPRRTSRQELLEEIEAATQQTEAADYELPSLDLLLESEEFCFEEHEREVRRKAKVLEKTFANFGFNIRVVEIQTGPVIAQFEVELEAGLRLSKITGLADDLAIALRVPSVRIVAPIPGKNTVGIEVPNAERQLVRLREVIEETAAKTQAMRIPIFLGKDVAGNSMAVDLSTMPHLLIAGRTGTGKSVCLNSIITSMLMTRRPDEVRMLLIDPKMVELSPYKRIPHLMHPVVTDMRKAEAILAWAVEKMEERYQLLAQAGVRHLSIYNQLGEEELRQRMEVEDDEQWAQIPKHLPYIVLVADEMADLMMTAAKEVEAHIIRLAQKSRAVGIHLVLATQKPTVDVITGLIKSNLPARIAFEVSSRTDSRVVLDEMGADKLLGSGDMLFLRPGTSGLIRGQGTFLSDDEIAKVIDAVATSQPQFVRELVQLKTAHADSRGPQLKDRDALYEAAVDVVVREGRGSVSLLQRTLGIGYGRAARLIDYMEEDGFVGPYNGSQAREVLLSVEDWEEMTGQEAAVKAAAPAKPRRDQKILLPRKTAEVKSPARDQDSGRRRPARPKVPAADEVPFDADEEEEEEFDDQAYEDGDQACEVDEMDEGEEYEEEEYDEEEDEYEEEELEDDEEYDEDVEGSEGDSADGSEWTAESA